MKILMMSNTYTPIVGGLERSVGAFSEEYRKRGHDVIIVAPRFKEIPKDEEDVIRVPAIQNFNGSDFSVHLPIPGVLSQALGKFKPDIVHSHHPYLIGDTALRVSVKHNVPLIFTHHTLYEKYTHYVPVDSPRMKRFVIELSTGYANLCDQVFAPSASIATLLKRRGVETPIDIVPTGIYPERFVRGDGPAFREGAGIPKEAFVVGHLGRLAPEKNLDFLIPAVITFLKKEPRAHFLVIGKGPSEDEINERFGRSGLSNHLHLVGTLENQRLIDAYHAMDVFVFASKSETQGLVLIEAMAAGVPVIAIKAPGVKEVIKDRQNGRLLPSENEGEFVSALGAFSAFPAMERESFSGHARKTAQNFSMEKKARQALSIYESLLRKKRTRRKRRDNIWETATRRVKAEWDLAANLAKATTGAVVKG